jgi:hypothetical protein
MDKLLEACVRASACGVKTYPILGNCVEAYFTLYLQQGISQVHDQIYSCVNDAGGDCAAIATCFGQRGDCDNTFQATCEGTVAVSCDLIAQRIYAVDCAGGGLECQVKKGGGATASCTPGICYSTFGNSCQGDRLLTCTDGVTDIHDCAAEGLICGSTYDKGAACIGETKEKCKASEFTPRCEGNVRITCVEGWEHREDCAGREMIASRCSGGDCAVSGTECDHALNRCAGVRLEACLDGRWVQFDCAKLGLGPCQVQGNAGNCTPPAP